MYNVYVYIFKSRPFPSIMYKDWRVQASMNQITQACPHTVYKALATSWVAVTSSQAIYYVHVRLHKNLHSLYWIRRKEYIEQNGVSLRMCKYGTLSISRRHVFPCTYNRYPITHPWGRDMECLLSVQSLSVSSCCNRNRVTLNRGSPLDSELSVLSLTLTWSNIIL